MPIQAIPSILARSIIGHLVGLRRRLFVRMELNVKMPVREDQRRNSAG